MAFNLGGPACITIVTLYLFNFKLNRNDLFKILFYSILPILSMSIVILFKMPDIQSYNFLPYSDPLTSGGYGPNQVSTIFGFIIVGIFLSQITKIYITGSRYIDLLCLVLFLGLGLITFSRGGLFTAIIAVIVSFSYYFFHEQKKLYFVINTILILLATLS